jgi:hypothetical protein
VWARHTTKSVSIVLQAQLIGFVILMLANLPLAVATPQDFQGWFITNAHISVEKTKTIQLYFEGQPRLGDDWKRAATFQGRAALVYNYDRSLGFYLGYAWTPSFFDASYHRDFRDEQRFWQQVVYRHDLFGLQWQHRLAEEQRILMRSSGIVHRIRYLVRGSVALNQQGNFGLTGYETVMVNLNDVEGVVQSGYDRNRIFFGPYWIVGAGRYEVGYLGEHLKRFGSDERWAHAILMSASYNF